MRILLIVYDNESYIHWFPQGLAYIAAVLRNAGHDVEIYDQAKNHFADSHLTGYLDTYVYDVVGLSAIGGYYQYQKLLLLSDAINKSRNRDKFVYVIGGHGPAPCPEYFLRKTKAEILVIGEGEETAIEWIECVNSPDQLHTIEGIAYREGEAIYINPRRELIPDIDSIPFPAYDLFSIDYYRLLRMPHCHASDFTMPVLSGRGCTFTCNFCYRLDKGFRPRSVEKIVEEVAFLQKQYGITYVTFSDELLMSSVKRTVELCEGFLSAGLRFKWACNGRLNYAKPEVLALMKKAGCVFINYGIEAMDNQILKNMTKALNTDIIVKGIENTLAAGISPGYNIIFGNIGESQETLEKGVEFLLKYDDGAQLRTIRPVTPYPGSPLFDYAVEKGLLKDCADFYENKHKNSDLLTVNFTNMSDDEFHSALYFANEKLINNYYRKRMNLLKTEMEDLYINKNASFRGFRQS